jgi:phosphatidylserine/phosphatidylglycerophosphate/cardiolipin synthase-like enzyme
MANPDRHHNIGLSRDCRDLFEHLAQRTEPLPRISEWFSRKAWPWDAKPLAYVDRRLVERSQHGCYPHAKSVSVDAGRPKAKALLTSANFSETAQRDNHEAGCLMTAPWQVDRISQHFQSLVAQQHFILLPL